MPQAQISKLERSESVRRKYDGANLQQCCVSLCWQHCCRMRQYFRNASLLAWGSAAAQAEVSTTVRSCCCCAKKNTTAAHSWIILFAYKHKLTNTHLYERIYVHVCYVARASTHAWAHRQPLRERFSTAFDCQQIHQKIFMKFFIKYVLFSTGGADTPESMLKLIAAQSKQLTLFVAAHAIR